LAGRSKKSTHDQNLPKILPSQTHEQKDNAAKMTRKINNETPTKCICHKGFSGFPNVTATSNFRVGGQETAPQSFTTHTLGR